MGNKIQKPHPTAIEYDQIKNQLNDLDLFFFAGNSFLSKTIEFFEYLSTKNGQWSHVGIVVSTNSIPDIQNAIPGEWYILEATLSTNLMNSQDFSIEDIESNKYVFGVQIRPLRDVLNAYQTNGRMGWGKLNDNPFIRLPSDSDVSYNRRIKKLRNKLKKMHDKYYHREYEINPCDIINSFQLCKGSSSCICGTATMCTSGNKYIFCSQLAAIVYQTIGIISKKVIPNKILPVELCYPEISPEYKEGIFPKNIVEKPIEVYVKN